MEYTGKESYGGTVDDGGRREIKGEVIEILDKSFPVYLKPFRDKVAQAIDDLYKGDENGLLSLEQVVKIYADAHWGSDIPDFNKVTDSLNEHFQVQQALDKKKEQERVERILKKLDACADYIEMNDTLEEIATQEGL